MVNWLKGIISLRDFLKMLTEGEKRMYWEGREFQRRGPATQNKQSPIACLVRETQRRCSFLEHRFSLLETYLMRKSDRKAGMKLFIPLKVKLHLEDDSLVES